MVKLNGGIEYGEHKFAFNPCPVAIGFNAAYLSELESGEMLINYAIGPVLINHENGGQTVLMSMRAPEEK